MAKVQISEAQAEFIETFGRRKYKALHYISRVGWDYGVVDGNDKSYNKEGKAWITVLCPEDFIEVKELLIRAVLDGYEINKEPLYTVEIPDPYGAYETAVLFRRVTGVSIHRFMGNKDWRKRKEYQLTEEEIKENHAWAWQFAEPVEEQ